LRLWSVHPEYLDSLGLVALWREALLAQKVLMGLTRGYRRHPQLERFSRHSDPLTAIRIYLLEVFREGERRHYRFDGKKIPDRSRGISAMISVTIGQMKFETDICLAN